MDRRNKKVNNAIDIANNLDFVHFVLLFFCIIIYLFIHFIIEKHTL